MGYINPNITEDNQLSKADMDLVISEINDNDERIEVNRLAIESGLQPSVVDILQLPTKINAVVGDTLQIFFNGMIKGKTADNFHFGCKNYKAGMSVYDLGKTFERYFEFTPTTVGDYAFTVGVWDSKGVKVGEKSTTISVKQAVQNPTSLIQGIAVGDSLTEANVWTQEFIRRITGTGGTPSGNGFANFNLINEGASGQTWNYFVTSTSPFWNSTTGQLDFEKYRIDNSLASLDVLYCLMTMNGIMNYKTDAEWIAWKLQVTDFIDAYLNDFPSGNVVLMSVPFPSTNSGLYSYGSYNSYYFDYMTLLINASKISEIYKEISLDPAYSSNVDHIACEIEFDSQHGYPIGEKAVNLRTTSIVERVDGGGVHPANNGYYQIADTSYRHFINKYCQ